eukprot:CAMPEP_0185711154 /NCGR_PEP_ID=MMETSP1164-20130828/32324_1 /TAXON_ID=1104430 /ORGANISM="Chrysoreinhardia sp, Strain CCMP2950" /LENGTH=31 /DNA_ID= /DNA_START= /DNA_END= /DNA_ORIENTATION=
MVSPPAALQRAGGANISSATGGGGHAHPRCP